MCTSKLRRVSRGVVYLVQQYDVCVRDMIMLMIIIGDFLQNTKYYSRNELQGMVSFRPQVFQDDISGTRVPGAQIPGGFEVLPVPVTGIGWPGTRILGKRVTSLLLCSTW